METKASRKTFRIRLNDMVNQLRHDIAHGRYAPGSYLPSESTLAEQHQLSNNTVRKGLDQLVQEGLIVKINRVGNMVTDRVPELPETVSVTLGCGPTLERDTALERLIDDFQRLHPTIRVRTLTIHSSSMLTSANYLNMIRTYMDQGFVDVFIMNHLNFLEFVENDSMHLLEPLPAERDIYPYLTDVFTHQGHLYVQPVVFTPNVLCYNRDHFRESGLPEPDSGWKWADAIRCAKQLSGRSGRFGLYFHLLSENRWPFFLLQSGEKFAPNGKGGWSIRGTKLLDSIRLCRDLIHDHDIFPNYLSESSDDVNQLFVQEKVSMIIGNYFTLNELKMTDIPYDISPAPFIDEPRTLIIPYGAAVNRQSKAKEAAKTLTAYFASERAQRLIRDQTLSIPARKPVAESTNEEAAGFNRPPHYQMFRELIPSFRLHRDLGLNSESFLIIRNLLKTYWSNMIDEDTLCDRLADPSSR